MAVVKYKGYKELKRIQNENKPPKKGSFWNKKNKKLLKLWLKRLAILAGAGFLLGVILLIGAFAWYSKDLPDPNKILERNVAQSTKLYDRTGETVLYDVHGDEKRTLVKLEDIPDYVKWATISAEDKHFYEHKGFNLLAIFKGTIIDPLMGKRARGGSTLTQQFVKNAILTNERRISRKIKEFILSYRIEKVFTKDEILQMYLNEIPYGSVSYGIQSASQTFLGKDMRDLTLGEAAVLAALPQAPTYYSPYGSHVDRLFVRQGYVLDQMVKNGYITQEEADTAAEEEIKFAIKRESIIAPHFVMYIKEILSEELGEDLLERGGLKVITTLDLDKQTIAEEAVVNGVEARAEQYGFHNAALLSLDTKTGQILAMVGSKDYFDLENDGNVNVTLSLRQPGSSMKPLVYAAAFNKGYTPNTVLYDVETTFKTDTKDYHPLNYDLKQHGPVTIRKALAGSLNIPAVKAIYLVGVQKVIDLLELMGYTTFEDRSRFGYSLVLGGGEVQMIEHLAAFASFANSGKYHSPVGILKVEDNKGNVLMEYKESERKVLDKNVAEMMTNVLSDNGARAYAFGAQNYLNLGSRPVAAKTGTTNDYRDAWTMGYTPSIATGVWAGNNDNTEMNLGAAGGVIAAPIWQEYMQKVTEGTEVEYFQSVAIPETGKPILDGEVAPEKTVRIDKYTGKLATELTPESYVEEKIFREAHCILHYVYKDDPRGGIPEDPSSADPAYLYWETAVQKWVEENAETEEGAEIIMESPPTEYDDVHIEENKPTVFINSPKNNSKIESATITAEVNLSAPRGIGRVEYYLDDKLIQSRYNYPFDLETTVSSYFSKGYHTLKVIAYDDVDNSNEAAVEVNITQTADRPNIKWLNPSNNTSLYQSSFPQTFNVRLTDRVATKKIDFTQKNKDTGQETRTVAVVLPQEDIIEIEWPEIFELGEYEFYAEITGFNGQKYRTTGVNIDIK